MAFTQRTSWCVRYGDAELNDSFDSLSFTDRADGGWSMAHHVTKPLGKRAEAWINKFSALIASGRDIEFTITDTSRTVNLPTQKHIIVGSRIFRRRSGLKFEFVTVEQRAKMLITPLMKHFEGEVSAIARKVIEESGLKAGTIESTQSPEEFKILHSPGWSAHEFINRHLVKRAVNKKGFGGFCLFSSNGDEVSFCTPGTVRSVIRPDPDQVDDSVEGTSVLSYAQEGGEQTGYGFDPAELMLLTSAGGEAPGKERGKGTLSEAESKALTVGLSQDAVKALAGVSASFAAWRRGYTTITLFGDANCGGKMPLKMVLSPQFFPEAKNAVAVARTHTVRAGSYKCSHYAVAST